MVPIFRFLILSFFLYSCNENNIGVIHWSTSFHNLSKEIRYSDSLSNRTAWMVRYFDVTWKNNKANPTAIASLPKNLPLQSAAVFIQRQVLEKTPRSQIPQLSNQIVSLIQQMEIGHQKAKEILIDFDWGKSTKENYFELIQQLKEKLPHKNISATVRLSQFANPRMYGVPPTDRGLLMMYQTGSLNQPEKPLLWEKTEVQQYLKQSNYPISLDVAIPAFSWSIIQRKVTIKNKKNISIVFPSYLQELQTNKHFKQIEPNVFLCIQPHFFHGFFLLTDDRVKCEKVSENDLKWAMEEAKSIAKKDGIVYLYLIEEASNGHYPADWFR
ncbi:MAG: hypothetical protein RLY64_468 [Bacteroidota bacterium]